MRIVVACATRHGSTAEIAAEIADVLRRNVSGAAVDLRDAAKAGEMAAYDAAVIGSAVYMGRWLPAARDLVQGHREVLSAMPVWLFSSGPLGDPSVPVDELAEVPALGVAIGARGAPAVRRTAGSPGVALGGAGRSPNGARTGGGLPRPR
jgi:menaquinone-dependent protoporphyrinogen oxidase